ncbi:MAG TPA: DNA polymerase III subunit delta [Gemmatimonadaceae bacterium]|nr:DNA polymerase III subunit delta [Gemmatimonadaceae bacterium]
MAANAAQKALYSAIERRAFDAAYHFIGDDDFRKHEALTLLINAAVDPATRDFNLEVRRGSEIGAETLGSVLGTPPMLAERRVVVIRDAGALKKDAKTAAEDYLQRPAPDVVFVLVQPAGEKPDPRFGRATTVVFDPITGPQLTRWIGMRAEHHGTSITAGAAELLQSSIGNDLPQLNVEIEKLATYVSGGPIDEAAVAAIVGVRREESLSALLDAVGNRDAATALRILPGLLEQPKSSGVFIVMVLGMQILGIGFARARLANRVPPARLNGEIMNMIKESGAYPGRSWTEAAHAWSSAAPKWSTRDLHAAAAVLHAADRAFKDSRVTSEEGILQSAILTMCKPASKRVA